MVVGIVGETIGSYRITGMLGEGGMGIVYAATHPLIGRRAAVKMLLPEFSQNADIVNRFFNEARATALIKHPGIVDVLDFGFHPSGSAYIVMEFLEGESLASRLRREQRLSVALIVTMTRLLASALGAAHEKGIVHRDLKPDNIFIVPDPDVPGGQRAKVLDFGIAKLSGDSSPGNVKTRTGCVMGTPYYMSPEQCRGAGEVDQRADVYSLGCIMYEMATGRPPFVGDGPGDLIAQHLREAPVPPSTLRPDLPRWMEELILRALAKRAEDRVQTMEQLAALLAPVPPEQPSQPPSAPSPATPGWTGHATTTLGSAASQVVARPTTSRRWLFAAAAAPIAIVAGYLLAGRGSTPTPTRPPPSAATRDPSSGDDPPAPAAPPPAAARAASSSEGHRTSPATFAALTEMDEGTAVTLTVMHPGLVEKKGTTGLATVFPEPCDEADPDVGARARHKLVVHDVPSNAAEAFNNGDAAGAANGSWPCFALTFTILGTRQADGHSFIDGKYLGYTINGSREFDTNIDF